MQPNTQILIVQKKYQINLAHPSFFGPSLFRPGPFGRTTSSPGLQAQKPGPGPGKWSPLTGPFGPWDGRPLRAAGCDPTAPVPPGPIKKKGQRPGTPKNPSSFFPSPSLSSPPAAVQASGRSEPNSGGAERQRPWWRRSGTDEQACLPCGRNPRDPRRRWRGGHVRPAAGLPAARGSRREPASRRCSGDGRAARGQNPGAPAPDAPTVAAPRHHDHNGPLGTSTAPSSP